MTQAPLEGVRACVFDAYGTLFDFAAADLAGVAESSRRDLKPEIGDFCLPAPARTRAMLD